ncbi:phosphoadenosine phosphosulfate reductase [Arthroderma uncinatum]|uniref:phosphoadenosine phosphosulfate reductase n=1 Tax=Arthroderma uncinatum TaxID=74035 RepID=UPI00144AC653|nr:phosphoadenosine phosphosulfate reductase [Arthroderma uncinatum]KAF3482349.1 phosphoadenosine phosphosulfate reductase [Arthroderma uncinatum]
MPASVHSNEAVDEIVVTKVVEGFSVPAQEPVSAPVDAPAAVVDGPVQEAVVVETVPVVETAPVTVEEVNDVAAEPVSAPVAAEVVTGDEIFEKPAAPAPVDDAKEKELESGYASGSGSATANEDAIPDLIFTKQHLQFLNQRLQFLEPQDVLKWCVTSLPGLFQSTSFGLTGLVILDMLSKLDIPRHQQVDLIFFDTLHHFQETIDLRNGIQKDYPHLTLHVYGPQGVSSAAEFAAKHGEKLWETNDELYDWLAKVEPAQRAYRELGVHAMLTGRRRSQGAKRGNMDIIEVDEAGLIKINPLANWTFDQVKDYVNRRNLRYNALLDRGYKSVGDYHSTQPVTNGEDERAGRWKGQAKTECGIHNPRSKYAQFLMDQELKRQEEAINQALHVAV